MNANPLHGKIMKPKGKRKSVDGLRTRTFPVPPEGFDPLSAPKAKLAYHGIAPRPDKNKERKLYKNWLSIYSKKLTHIVPEFFSYGVDGQRPNAAPRKVREGPTNSETWSGVAVVPPVGDAFTLITGRWIIPHPKQPPGVAAGQVCHCASWIGMDGWVGQKSELLQAGTDATIQVQDSPVQRKVWAWWEWIPDGPVAIRNLPVTSGDKMACLIHSTGPRTARIYIVNLSSRTHSSHQVTIPKGATFTGSSAEWIVEAPLLNDGPPTVLANYGTVNFTESFARSAKKKVICPASGQTIDMYDSVGAPPVSVGSIGAAKIVTVMYK
jgi:hypothetical protein